jgi:ApaG protein
MLEQLWPMKITVTTAYLSEHSPENKYAFSYNVSIKNLGASEIKLVNRYWLITDGNGKVSEVRGPGVVGQQPLIAPGQSFRYASGAILDTPVGTMQGYYEMQDGDGNLYQAPIDVFGLAVPNLVN